MGIKLNSQYLDEIVSNHTDEFKQLIKSLTSKQLTKDLSKCILDIRQLPGSNYVVWVSLKLEDVTTDVIIKYMKRKNSNLIDEQYTSMVLRELGLNTYKILPSNNGIWGLIEPVKGSVLDNIELTHNDKTILSYFLGQLARIDGIIWDTHPLNIIYNTKAKIPTRIDLERGLQVHLDIANSIGIFELATWENILDIKTEVRAAKALRKLITIYGPIFKQGFYDMDVILKKNKTTLVHICSEAANNSKTNIKKEHVRLLEEHINLNPTEIWNEIKIWRIEQAKIISINYIGEDPDAWLYL